MKYIKKYEGFIPSESEEDKKWRMISREYMTGCKCTECDCEDCKEDNCTCDCCIDKDTFICDICEQECDVNNSNSECSTICQTCIPEEDK